MNLEVFFKENDLYLHKYTLKAFDDFKNYLNEINFLFDTKDTSLVKHSLNLSQKYINIFNFGSDNGDDKPGIVELIKYALRSQIELTQAISIPIAENKYGAEYENFSSQFLKKKKQDSSISNLKEWKGKFNYFNQIRKEAGDMIHYFHLLTKEELLSEIKPKTIYKRFGVDEVSLKHLNDLEMQNITGNVLELFKKDCNDFLECLKIFSDLILNYKNRKTLSSL